MALAGLRRWTRPSRLPVAFAWATVLAQIAYPLAPQGPMRDRLTVVTVVLFFLASVSHALVWRGAWFGGVLVLVTAGGGLIVEAVGVATGLPFGTYSYTGSLGWTLLGVPVVIPLAWTMMAYPALLVGQRIVCASIGFSRGRQEVPEASGRDRQASQSCPALRSVSRAGDRKFPKPAAATDRHRSLALRFGRFLARATESCRSHGSGSQRLVRRRPASAVPPSGGWSVVLWPVAGWALASWDLFLDPQMVDAGHWIWQTAQGPTLSNVPLTNFAGWWAVATVMMALLSALTRQPRTRDISTDRTAAADDRVPYGLYLWTYASSVLAHAAFFGLPGSALAGGLGMGAVVVAFLFTLRR